jgi:hypothetical protein
MIQLTKLADKCVARPAGRQFDEFCGSHAGPVATGDGLSGNLKTWSLRNRNLMEASLS